MSGSGSDPAGSSQGDFHMVAASLPLPDATQDTAPRQRTKRLLMLAVPLVLSVAGAGLWYGGVLPPLLGMAHGTDHGDGKAKAQEKVPSFAEIPEIVANLNGGPRRTVYVKLHARLELARAEDEPAVKAAMPRVLDMFQTYLREMRPEELRGSAGTYRLREELLGRANIALAPVRVADVLFTEMLIQ
jgi:flagellar FliL protein